VKETKQNRRDRMARLRKFRKERDLCIRCGEPNNRLPKVTCKECAVKAAFEHEKYRDKRNVNILKELRLLNERVTRLEELDGRIKN
jgi:NMD protein affecting ribosome stability and mRNA decay